MSNDLNLVMCSENHDWKIELLDYNKTKHFYKKNNISNWLKYYGEHPYCINCVRVWDDDIILTKYFNSYEDALYDFENLSTVPTEVDLRDIGYK